MKLTILFMTICIGASISQNLGDLMRFQQQYPAIAQRVNPSYVLLVDQDNLEDAERDDVSEESDQINSIPPRFRGTGYPSLHQYHQNENVNQYYYPQSSPYQSIRDRNPFGQTNSRQKTRLRPFARPIPNPIASSPRFFDSFQHLLFPAQFFSYLAGISTNLYPTTTSYMIFNSTVTTTLVTTCVPIAQFAGAAPAQSTLSCRRKRDIAIGDLIDDDVNEPEAPEMDLPDDMHQMMNSNYLDEPGRSSGPEIASSKDNEYSERNIPQSMRHPRFLLGGGGNSVRTFVSTFTSYSFVTLNATRTLSVAGAAQLVCLPAGYKVC